MKVDLVNNSGGSNLLNSKFLLVKQKQEIWLFSNFSEVFSKTLAFARKVVSR